MDRKEKINFLTQNVKGIGPVKADKLADAFAEVESFTSLAYNKDAFAKMKDVLGPNLAQSFMDQLIEIKRQDESVQLMVECGIPYFSAINLAKMNQTFEAFKKDPYKIGRQNNIKFECCDRFAHIIFNNGYGPSMSKSRMHYMIEAMLTALENSGHTFAYLNQLTRKINLYQKRCSYYPDCYEPSTVLLYLIGNEFIEVERHDDINKWKIYRKTTYDLENDIAYHIKRLSINRDTSKKIEFTPLKIKYDDIQLSAIKSASMSGLKVVTGPPGSGKTAVINGIISYFKQMKPSAKITLCAPTGRAAKHMTEITGVESSTIHRLLGISETSQFMKKQKLTAEMVICDEASMLNLELTYELLSRIENGAVVYFVGDKDQLPAVGPGNVLHDIINSGVVPVYQLTKVYRQDGIILENAHEINGGTVPTKTSELYTVNTYDDPLLLQKELVKKFDELYDLNEPFETQILVPSYKTECGITALNAAIQELNPNEFIYKSSTHKCAYKKNDKILMTKNHRDGLYQNGSVGLFLANYGEELLIEFDGEEVKVPKESIEDMTLGYAISVHKSQGSEYKHVLFCLPSEPKNMLKRNISYTAVTRAKHDIAIFEMRGAMETSVKTNMELFMQTGLREKLIPTK